jgi:signal peptidase
MGAFAVVAKLLIRVGIAAALLLAAAVLVPAALGYERYVITGNSMAGSYDRGSLLFAEVVPVEELEVGDVITYDPPPRAGVDGLTTHRIVSIRDGAAGATFRTGGDANAAPDPWRFRLEQPTQARAAFAFPYAGYALAALGVRSVRMLVVGLPALLIALALIARLWREAGEQAKPERPPGPVAAASGDR